MSRRRRSSRKRPEPEDEDELEGDELEPRRGCLASLFIGLLKLAVLLGIWGTVAVGAVVIYYASDMPDVRQVTQPERRPSITVLAEDGTVLARAGDLFGTRVSMKDVPPHLIHAVLAIEDRRFYSHFGLDLIGLTRAFVQNLRAGRVVQGGSTLTQQLAKNLFLTPDRTFRRKVQEMLLALWLEHTYSKDQILTAYLNRVYMGAGAYGVDAAAETYFGKHVDALTLRESAMLAGLLRAPSRFAPSHDWAQSTERARTVLAAMEDAGYISEEERKNAIVNVPLPRRKPGAGGDGRYFADWIVDQANAILESEPQDLIIATTLDVKLQQAAERHLDAFLSGEGRQGATQGALVTLAPDGAVRAMVGGRDYDESQYNRATQAQRQPGSAFKPVIYLTALEKGLSPNDVIEDAPIRIGKWAPENYDNTYRGPITVRQALAESVNTVAVRILQQVGVEDVVATARRLGVTSPVEPHLSLALGTNTVTPLELTGVYATLAAGGRAITPWAIQEIRTREGKVLYRRAASVPPVVVNPDAVATLVDMMGDVVRVGTGRKAALDRPVAGKTGTSSEYRDAWFLGFTADYVTGVWLGNDDNEPMKKVTGGSLPAELWRGYMQEAEAGLPPRLLLENRPTGWAGDALLPVLENTAEGVSDLLGDLIRSLTGEDGKR